ncbi:MAG: transglutaminase-like domain-containing protein [Candidatus Woesearchaeota archaeon]
MSFRLYRHFLFVFFLALFYILIFPGDVNAEATESDILHSREAVLDLTMSGSVEIIPDGTDYGIDELTIRTHLYPRDSFHQSILDFRTHPGDYSMEEDAVVLNWKDPETGVIDYEIFAEIETDGRRSEVRRKIDFPHDASSFDKEVNHYLQSAELIDSDDPEVAAKAAELVEGIDDYYEVVLTLARWVNENVDYNLSTLNEDAERSASWVLQTRRGVCAEMTSLFVAMLRSLDIPARYVSGVSYTDSELFDFNWGAHGWADVYFPGHGWVPFDVTYGQYGYVDPSHMKLRETLDSGEPSSHFQWYGHNIDVESTMLDFDVDVLESIEREKDDVEIDITTRSEEVSFGSYNLVIATVKNLRNYYLPVTLTMSRTRHLDLLDAPRQEILLLPGEERKMYWRVHVDPDLSMNSIYTFPIQLSSPSGHSATESFTARASGTEFSLEAIDAALKSRLERGKEPYSSNVDFVCSWDDDVYYPDEPILLECVIDNEGDLDLEDLEVCMHDDPDECETIDLLGRTSHIIEFSPDNDGPGSRNIGLSLENEDVTITDDLELSVKGYPAIRIKDIELPSQIDHGSGFNLSFLLDGDHSPEDVNVRLSMNKLNRTWHFDRLSKDREFSISMSSRDLFPGENTIDIRVDFRDARGERYTVSEELSIELVNIPFFDNIFMRIRLWLESLIS